MHVLGKLKTKQNALKILAMSKKKFRRIGFISALSLFSNLNKKLEEGKNCNITLWNVIF